jgi:hypothetical protein
MLERVEAKQPEMVQSDGEALGALGIAAVKGPDQRGIDVREIGDHGIGPLRYDRGTAGRAGCIDEVEEEPKVPLPHLVGEFQPGQGVVPNQFVHLIAGTAVRVGEALDQGQLAESGQCSQVGTGDHFGRLASEAADKDPQSLKHRAIGLAQPAPRTVQHSLDAAMPLLDETGRIGPHDGADPS